MQEMTLAVQANNPPTPFHPAFVVFVVPDAVAHRAMGWGDGRIAQVVFFGR